MGTELTYNHVPRDKDDGGEHVKVKTECLNEKPSFHASGNIFQDLGLAALQVRISRRGTDVHFIGEDTLRVED